MYSENAYKIFLKVFKKQIFIEFILSFLVMKLTSDIRNEMQKTPVRLDCSQNKLQVSSVLSNHAQLKYKRYHSCHVLSEASVRSAESPVWPLFDVSPHFAIISSESGLSVEMSVGAPVRIYWPLSCKPEQKNGHLSRS